jgi:hypothetical protein
MPCGREVEGPSQAAPPRLSARPGVGYTEGVVGPVWYVRHEGGRPMAIEWALEHPIPGGVYQRIKVAAG